MIKDIQQPEKSRNHDIRLLKPFEAFEPVESQDDTYGTSGNIKVEFEKWNIGSNTYKTPYGKDSQKPFYDLISAPMLLARLAASGVASIFCERTYKTTFYGAMKHKETGCIVTFYDWKGASGYGSCRKGLENEAFKKDVIKVLRALINPRFPHPYDGCVIGEIA